jgi:hypothetical protein
LHVSKRWAAWPPGIRWLAGGIAAVVLALAVAYLVRCRETAVLVKFAGIHWTTEKNF